MPSFGDQVRDWQRGAQAVARGDWDSALRLFSSDPDPPARMCFNLGCVHLLAGDPEAALRAFDRAVTKDVCMAVGFFQRGVTNFQLQRSREALSDFQVALELLRGNAAIDYTQLGLRFRLQAWEVLFNVASAQCRLGLWAQASRSLKEAISKGPEGVREDLSTALEQVQLGAHSCTDAQDRLQEMNLLKGGGPFAQKQACLQPRQVPRGEVFRPHKWHLRHLAPVDFLGESKVVVASAVPDDQHQGVQPQQPQVQDEACDARPRAGPRTHNVGPCRPGTPLSPRTPPEADMEVGSGPAGRADRYTPGTYDGQKPHTEQAGPQVPPELPAARGPDPAPSQDPSGAGGVAVGDPEDLVPITVQCAFTLTLKAPRGADLRSLRALLSQALPIQARCGQLSYQDPGDGHWVPLPEEAALQRVWRDTAPGPTALRLLCRGVGGRPVLYQVVAQHGYAAQGPEDLDLQPGDAVDVLCEVDRAWLEGHCAGRVGIFPKSFVVPASRCVRRPTPLTPQPQ